MPLRAPKASSSSLHWPAIHCAKTCAQRQQPRNESHGPDACPDSLRHAPRTSSAPDATPTLPEAALGGRCGVERELRVEIFQ